MPKKVIVSGKCFHSLTVLRRLKDGRWRCVCACGRFKDTSARCLTNHSTKSCGCMNPHRPKSAQERRQSNFKYLHAIHCRSGKKRGKGWLAFDDWIRLVVQPCFYCGDTDVKNRYAPPSVRKRMTNADVAAAAVRANGVDRLNPLKPYTLKNSVSCCCRCSMLKGGISYWQFIEHCCRIVHHERVL